MDGASTAATTWRIHGNIGAGKTSVMQAMQGTMLNGKKVRCYFEDTASWAPWLDRLYKAKDPKTEAPRIQLCVMGHFLNVTRQIMEAPADTVNVVERGPDTVRDIFLPVHQPEEGDALDHMYPILDAVFFDQGPDAGTSASASAGAADLPWNTARDIYLRVSPELCLQRIQQRARECETSSGADISLEYLQTLHALHDAVYLGRDDVYVVDVPNDPEEILRRFTPNHIASRLCTDMLAFHDE